MRPLHTPQAMARAQMYDPPEALSEITIAPPGQVPVRAVVPTREVSPRLVEQLHAGLKDLPRLAFGAGQGAVDIRLEDPEGRQVKTGSVLLAGPDGNLQVPIDPVTRRFRRGGLPAGEYELRAASSGDGRGVMRLAVREGDVTRAAARLDGSALRGRSTVRFGVRGTRARELRVRGTDLRTGKLVVDTKAKVSKGFVELDLVPHGAIHWDLIADDARSCYDSDVNDVADLFDVLDIPVLAFAPGPIVDPDPPDWRFDGLPLPYAGVARILPEIGIHSLEELAAAEPEDLFHRLLARNERNERDERNERNERNNTGESDHVQRRRPMPVHSRMIGEAVNAARTILGARRTAGEDRAEIRLAQGATYARDIAPRSAGEAEFMVDLGPGKQGELLIQGPQGTERRKVNGSERVTLSVRPEDIAAGGRFQLSLTNLSGGALTGIVHTRLPADRLVHGFHHLFPTVKEQIESILRGLAARNPGLGASVPDAIMAPENIDMWLDRARSFMTAAGVCSINDLGRFRLDPMRILRTGAYVAPVVQPPTTIPPLTHYAFSELLSNTVLYYEPNDVLHDTAVILAGSWDIRGQQVIIGKEVRELVVIAGSILHDGATRISWELPALPGAHAYWPNPAPSGGNGTSAGAAGQDGGDGDGAPHPSKNGGADAVSAGPTVTMYLLNATGNLPRIELNGQKGGDGGRGQDGGRGGDGAQGERADGTFFGGCCRDVGFGGRGGQGGDGGRGGKGGRGGAGGRITVLTTPSGIAVMAAAPPPIDVKPGEGGEGGAEGNPGGGGIGGPAGTADCETWCDEMPERRGADGAGGAAGSLGFKGDAGPPILEDAIQILPITPEQWQQAFNNPHILTLDVYDAEPGQTVQITGMHFDPAIDRVYFDGVNLAPVTSSTQASFTVPLDAEGGYHPVVIRPPGVTGRRSNRAMLRVLPKLDAIAPGTRFVENQNVTLTGLAFRPGLQVIAEDRSTSPATPFALPVVGVTRTAINIQIPGGFLGALRGVRRIVVQNPDGGRSRDERVARISDTIVVRCAAFRVVGATAGVGTTRSAAEITNLFAEGAVHSVNVPWGQARIVFRLVQPVATVTTTDTNANVWPGTSTAVDQALFTAAPGVAGALNFFFVRDVDISTAYAYFGGGPIFMGDEGGPLGPVDWQQVAAHEIGHALCLRHQCDGAGEGPGTFFNRACDDDEDDNAFLMYPFWNSSDGMAIHPGQVDPARIGASNLEDGKTTPLPTAALFQTAVPTAVAQCLAPDLQN
ncbi:hypothetical protein [Massilia sp. DD77]|uniref:hypothetical protein n=1 Tax=Massilia sp. DD77 TaxID=3109349 RepID=UPI002FFE1C5F